MEKCNCKKKITEIEEWFSDELYELYDSLFYALDGWSMNAPRAWNGNETATYYFKVKLAEDIIIGIKDNAQYGEMSQWIQNGEPSITTHRLTGADFFIDWKKPDGILEAARIVIKNSVEEELVAKAQKYIERYEEKTTRKLKENTKLQVASDKINKLKAEISKIEEDANIPVKRRTKYIKKEIC